MHVQTYHDYVKETYEFLINQFGKFITVKSSLHWTLAHIFELIVKNGSYTLADFSENSFKIGSYIIGIQQIIQPEKQVWLKTMLTV